MASPNEFGSPDLDLRPASMRRHNMYTWIKRCPRCLFSAYSMERNDGVDQDSINEHYNANAYLLDLISGNKKETLAEFFHQVYFKRMEQQKYGEAATNAIRAAWDCDDRENEDGAFVCRNLAIDAIDCLPSPDETILVIEADLLRRAARFDEVIESYAGFHSAENPFLNSHFLSVHEGKRIKFFSAYT